MKDIFSSKAIVFDLDWTLYDAGIYYNATWKDLSSWIVEKGKTSLSHQEVHSELINVWQERGPSSPDIIDRWLNNINSYSSSLVKSCVHYIHSERPYEIRPYDKIEDLLKLLSSKNKLGLLTEGRNITQRRKLKYLGLEKYFDVFLSTEEVGYAKVSGTPFEQICSQLTVAPGEVVSIGDTYKKDILPPMKSGACTIWLRTNPFEPFLEKVEADYEILDSIALFDLFANNEN